MKEQLRRQEQKILNILSDQNDQQQYDRRWNVRVYNMEEKAGETADDCAKKCCQIFTDLIGIPMMEEDLEAAHRTRPTMTGKRHPIIVRFQSRKLKDKVFANRRKLKGKGVWMKISGQPTTNWPETCTNIHTHLRHGPHKERSLPN